VVWWALGSAIVAGVDGGATKTRALVLDAESLAVGLGLAGPSNPTNVGVEKAARNIAKAVSEAASSIGASVDRIEVVYAGLAGVDSELVRREVAPDLQRLSGLGERLIVDHDAYISLLSATRGQPGILVIAGTGSIVFALTGKGERVIVGDRGWLLGDEGSGFWVARLALRRLLKALDGRRSHDCLTRSLAEKLHVKNSDELMYWFYHNRSVENIASVARHVAEAAGKGCWPAEAILRLGARLLARAVLVASRRTGLRNVYITGSMFTNKPFLEEFTRILSGSGVSVAREKLHPVTGAIYAALKIIGFEKPEIAFDPNVVKAAAKLYQ
jgi:glucosamine kinase